VPIGSVLPNDCPTRIIKWLSIIWRFQRGGKIIMNGYVFDIDAHDSESGWKTRRRQNDLQWKQLGAGNEFSETIYRIQAWRIAGATAYVMNCNLWPSDCTNINIVKFWASIEQYSPINPQNTRRHRIMTYLTTDIYIYIYIYMYVFLLRR